RSAPASPSRPSGGFAQSVLMMECRRVRGAFGKSQRSAQREVLMHRHMPLVGVLSLAAVVSLSSGASGQLAVSANDGKAVLTAGVSINRAGTLALVANRSEGTVSVFSIAGHTLTPVGKISLGDDKSGPSHVAIAPDGKTALVTRDNDHKISVLSIDGTKVEYT